MRMSLPAPLRELEENFRAILRDSERGLFPREFVVDLCAEASVMDTDGAIWRVDAAASSMNETVFLRRNDLSEEPTSPDLFAESPSDQPTEMPPVEMTAQPDRPDVTGEQFATPLDNLAIPSDGDVTDTADTEYGFAFDWYVFRWVAAAGALLLTVLTIVLLGRDDDPQIVVEPVVTVQETTTTTPAPVETTPSTSTLPGEVELPTWDG